MTQNDVAAVDDGKEHTFDTDLYTVWFTNGNVTVNGNVLSCVDCASAPEEEWKDAKTLDEMIQNWDKSHLIDGQYGQFDSGNGAVCYVKDENDYVVYMTEIGVQLGKGDEFANGVLKEMKAAVEKEVGIMVMIAGTVMNQPNEWLSLEVYQNKDAYQKHLETKHFKRYLEATKFCVESKGLHLLKSDFVSDQGQIFYRP